ncbi:hypothetical protein HU200_058430 [Digitaria exilis]|uniref:DUF4378 domain-containing protein n=1 Tax=Digitaria exilis TaxID=1010633 RepID=A0A835ADF8_9POAL|nr:hypothetical protein HU200_058430 [Digitaria exilis]
MSQNTKPQKRSSNLHNSRAFAEKPTPTYRYREIPIQPPNVIARLMGIDAFPAPPPPPKPAAAAAIIQAQSTTRSLLKPPPPAAAAAAVAETTKVAISPRSAPFRQAKCSLLSYRTRNNGGDSTSSSTRHCLKKMRVLGRSRSRHRRLHPQEDLLQKMKQDFQAWQASRAALVDACSATHQPLDGRCIQMTAQENLRRQKMARYGFNVADDCSKVVALEKKGLRNAVVVREENDSETAATTDEPLEPPSQETVITVLRATSPCAAAVSEKFKDFEPGKDGHDRISSASDEEMLCSTAPIVLLKPASSDILLLDVADGCKKPLFGLPKLNRNGNISRLLQEVKEMLHKELQQVNASSSNKVTWATGAKEQIGRSVAKQTREETAAEDRLSKRFSRSESFRGFRSDRRRNEATTTTTKQASPERVGILTRNNILARKPLKRVTSLRDETVSSPTNKDEESMSSCSITSRGRFRSLADVSPSGVGFGEQSFRSECLMMRHNVSPARALFRSFSAPESGFFSLGLFGDGGVRSATHEASEGAAAVMTSQRSTSFSFIRGTVSSLRHSFNLRRHLFRRKMHWSKKMSLEVGEIQPQMATGTTPPSPETFNLFKVAQAKLSPKCLSEFEAPASELSYRTDITVETACNHDKAYIRDILVAAGLYDDDGSLDNKANGRVDSMARPICDDIFEEVEDIYYYRGKYCDDAIGVCNDDAGGNAADHRMLFDLANEALQSLVMQGAKVGCSLRQWVIDSTGVSRGRRLVDDVWQQVQILRNPEMQEMQTIDSMVAYEIRKSVWADVLYEDVYVVGRKIERAIFDELIEDLLIEVFI